MTRHDFDPIDTAEVRHRATSAADAIVEDLDARLALSDRERDIARGVAVAVVDALPSVLPGFGHRPLSRLASLEVRADDADKWRLNLTGVADGNGRIGTLARAVETIRIDIGDAAACREMREAATLIRSVRRRLIAAVGAAAIGIGGGAYSIIRTREASASSSAATAARVELRLQSVEAGVLRAADRIDRALGHRVDASSLSPPTPPGAP